MRKSVFPRTRICTILSELPHVEIHKSMCKSAPAEILFFHVEIHMRSCISARRNTPKIVDFPMCGNTHFLVYFHMRKFERESEFPQVNFASGFVNFHGEKRAGIHLFSGISTCGNTRGSVNFRMRKYTRKGVIPHAVIHLRVVEWVALIRFLFGLQHY